MAGHILLAEDDKALSALMQDFFRAAGVTVTPAYDGEQGLHGARGLVDGDAQFFHLRLGAGTGAAVRPAGAGRYDAASERPGGLRSGTAGERRSGHFRHGTWAGG